MSDSDRLSNLERRLEALEKLVLERTASVPPPLPTQSKPPPLNKAAPSARLESPPSIRPAIKQPPPPSVEGKSTSAGERWLARSGVLFLFLALSFLFKYAADQGWINPTVRVGFGVVLATTMLITGLKLHATRLRYSQILLGGSIAIYYLCGYAAHQFYGLMEHTPAFVYMVSVTLGALVLAVKQDHPSLACIGITGGLMTPFLLDTPWGTIPALVLYSSTLLLGGGGILLRRGWRTLAATLWMGGLPVVFYCIEEISLLDRDFMMIGLPLWWAVGGLMPFLYNWKSKRFPAPSAQAPFPSALLRIGAIGSSAITFLLTAWNWKLVEREELWPLALLFAVGYALLHSICRNNRAGRSVTVEMAVGFGFVATAIAFENDAAFFAILAEAAALLYLGRYATFASSRMLSYGVLGGLAFWFGADCIEYLGHRGEIDPMLHMLTRLALLPAFVWASTFPKEENLRSLWRLLAYVGLLTWTFTELRWLEHGIALTTAAWAAQGGVALLYGLKTRHSGTQNVALSTLALVSGKMLLFDMANTDMIWRILLFFGVGAAFLGLSYLMNRPRHAAGRRQGSADE